MAIRHNKTIDIDEKVLNLGHIQDLAAIAYEEYKKGVSERPEDHFRIRVDCSDGNYFDSDTLEIFENHSPILKRRVDALSINYEGGKDKHIIISITHGGDSSEEDDTEESWAEIGGLDSFWVSAIHGKLSEAILLIPDQNNWLPLYKRHVNWCAFFIGTYFTGEVIDFFNRSDPHFVRYWRTAVNTFGDFIESAIVAALGGGLIVFVTNYFIEKADKMWPRIELQIGEDHLHFEKKTRTNYWIVISLVIIPFFLSIISTALLR